MDLSDEPRDLERQIEQATRIAARVTDQTTVERLSAWIQDLRQRREARRIQQAVTARAREIWVEQGRPEGRDLEFWLRAESEIKERH